MVFCVIFIANDFIKMIWLWKYRVEMSNYLYLYLYLYIYIYIYIIAAAERKWIPTIKEVVTRLS